MKCLSCGREVDPTLRREYCNPCLGRGLGNINQPESDSTNPPELMAQGETGRSSPPVAPVGWGSVDTSTPHQGLPSPVPAGHIRCCLCGQVYPTDSGPCGCGHTRTVFARIPKTRLREWRRGLMTIDGGERITTLLTPLMLQHAREIRAEIEDYLK